MNGNEFEFAQQTGKSLERNRILKLLSQKLHENEELSLAQVIELIVTTAPKPKTGMVI